MKKIFGLGEFTFKGVNSDDGTFEAVISGIKTDRYGDTINPEGWVLKNFNKNPVLLWAHDHHTPTVGRALKVWVEGKVLMMKGEFAPTPFAQELKLLAENGFLRAFSVGFKPIDYKFNDNGVDFLSQELLEVSFVNVPAYAEALMKTVDGDQDKYKNFIAGTDKSLNWDGLKEKDGRAELLQEKKDDDKIEEEKIVFTKSEFNDFKKELEIKAGKVLSKKNRNLVKSVIGAMDSALTPLKELLEATNDEADDKGAQLEAKGDDTAKATKDELIKIAGKAIESYLIKSREDRSKK
ncbi:MAG TPA: hypothetical protein DDY21_00280 [Candidatus Moranbacteria bacterium]|nr:hypothetical protein [Candidatus Moranbacteria bacterium]